MCVPVRGGTLENDPAVGLLIITWIVQGLINTNPNDRNSINDIVTPLHDSVSNATFRVNKVRKPSLWISKWIRNRVSEHVQEYRLHETIQLLERRPPLRPQFVRFVQNGRDAALFWKGWE